MRAQAERYNHQGEQTTWRVGGTVGGFNKQYLIADPRLVLFGDSKNDQTVVSDSKNEFFHHIILI